MSRTIRSKNVDLIRWLNFGHAHTAQKLAAVTNANYLSKMATGDMEVDDRMARNIEEEINFPSGWLDRDNVALIMMTSTDFKLHQLLLSYSEDAKVGLIKFLMSRPQQEK